jgi:hypothetical protein
MSDVTVPAESPDTPIEILVLEDGPFRVIEVRLGAPPGMATIVFGQGERRFSTVVDQGTAGRYRAGDQVVLRIGPAPAPVPLPDNGTEAQA